MAKSDPREASPAASLEDIEARVGRRERRTVIGTVALTIVFVAVAATLLLLSVGEVRKTQSELDESQTLLLAQLAHDQQVTSASFHPDAEHVLTASADGLTRVWDWQAQPPRVVAELRQTGPVSSAAFSPDGRLVVVANQAGTAVVWDWRNETVLKTLPHDNPVARAEFDHEGRRVVTAAGDQARIWDWRSGRLLATLRHSTPVSTAAFGAGGLVVTGSADRARVWDIRSTPPRLLAVLPRPVPGGSAVPTFDAGFGPDGAVVTATTGEATIYDAERVAEPDRLTHAGDVTSAAISPDGTQVLTTSSAGAALLWPRRRDTTPLVLRPRDASGLLDAGFSLDGELVVTASSDGKAGVYRPAQPQSGSD